MQGDKVLEYQSGSRSLKGKSQISNMKTKSTLMHWCISAKFTLSTDWQKLQCNCKVFWERQNNTNRLRTQNRFP